ncbi:hypothetical protein FKM82_003979 [Ascaphus truei]
MCSVKIMLCVALLVASAIVTVTCDSGKFSSCCTRVSSAKTKVAITDFIIQKLDLPCVEAVIFITKDGKLMCSKPNLPWVVQKIKEIKQKKELL